MGDNTRRFLTAVVCGASGALVALAGSGMADADPIPPPAPAPAPVLPAERRRPHRARVALAVEPAPAAATCTRVSAGVRCAGEAPPPAGIPHLASPDALPPGSTMDPSTQGNEGPNVSYLKDLWHAVQNQEISGKEALIMGWRSAG